MQSALSTVLWLWPSTHPFLCLSCFCTLSLASLIVTSICLSLDRPHALHPKRLSGFPLLAESRKQSQLNGECSRGGHKLWGLFQRCLVLSASHPGSILLSQWCLDSWGQKDKEETFPFFPNLVTPPLLSITTRGQAHHHTDPLRNDFPQTWVDLHQDMSHFANLFSFEVIPFVLVLENEPQTT